MVYCAQLECLYLLIQEKLPFSLGSKGLKLKNPSQPLPFSIQLLILYGVAKCFSFTTVCVEAYKLRVNITRQALENTRENMGF